MALVTFEDLPSTNTPINANNLNNNFNELNNANIYSASEIKIGTFLNKPLYRKVIDCGQLPNTTLKDVSTGLSNVIVQNIYGKAYNSGTGNSLPLPYVTIGTAGGVMLAFNSNNVRIQTDTDRSGWTGIVILEYTKNSD